MMVTPKRQFGQAPDGGSSFMHCVHTTRDDAASWNKRGGSMKFAGWTAAAWTTRAGRDAACVGVGCPVASQADPGQP
jgi:hypothetical protein